MAKPTPFLWFDTQAEEAANHYVSIFKNAKVISTLRYGDAGPGPKGSVMTIVFELDGQRFTALNGGPRFSFDEAISFVIECQDQDEVDHYWERLTADGGAPGNCGWLRDKFGLAWQVVPVQLMQLAGDADAVKAQRTVAAMLKMNKLDIAELERAHRG